MRSLKVRLDKLTNKTSRLPELFMYKIGEDVEFKSRRNSGVVIYLPDNYRDDSTEIDSDCRSTVDWDTAVR